MQHLFSIALLLTMLGSRDQRLPDEFHQLPEPLRDSATLVISGTFGRGRTPCMPGPNGTRRWAIDSWFTIKTVYRGKVAGRSVRVNTSMLPATEYVNKELKQEHEYLVLLRPRTETMKKIKAGTATFWDAVRDEEILAIVESRQ